MPGRCDDCGAYAELYEFPNRGERAFVVAGEERCLPIMLCLTCRERRWWNDSESHHATIDGARDARGVFPARVVPEEGRARSGAKLVAFWNPERVLAFMRIARSMIDG